jgi:tetratricopeptide (TPR) repeat protein
LQYEKAHKLFNIAITQNEDNDSAWVGLGWVLYSQGKYTEAARVFSKACEVNPYNDYALVGLGWSKHKLRQYAEAVRLFEQARTTNKKNIEALLGLAWDKYRQHKYFQALAFFEKVLAIDPNNTKGVLGKAWVACRQFRYEDAIALFSKSLGPETNNIFALKALALCYRQTGKESAARKYDQKADKLLIKTYNTQTQKNYLKLYKILKQRKIPLVCVQYPLRDVSCLRNMFKQEDEVLFVDNRRVFKKALEDDEYSAYFSDNFAGDFGHCTDRGNRLLANNIAKKILEAFFLENNEP